MPHIRIAIRNARRTLATVGVLMGVLSVGAPMAFANDPYPPGRNVKTDVPPSTIYTYIPSWFGNVPYWVDQKWPGNIPSRYSPDLCHWDWCKTAVQKPATATAKN